MDQVTAPSSTTAFRSGEQEEEHHEKKPVLKKVMDKVKKIKKVIRKKTPGHGNGGDDDDHRQDGEFDEEDEEFEEDEEINEDPAVHGVPTAGATGFERSREYESPATGLRTGANESSGVLITEKFVGDLAPPGTEPEANSGIEQSRAYDEKKGGGGEGTDGVGDGLGVIKEDFVEDPALQPFKSQAIDGRAGTNELSTGGGEGAERVNDDLGSIAKLTTEAETNTRNEQSRGLPLHENPVTGAGTGVNEVRRGGEAATGDGHGLGLNTKDFVQEPAEPRTDDELNTRIEQSRVNLSPKTGSRAGLNDFSRVGETAEGVGYDPGVINMELVEDPAAPKSEAELNTQKEQSRGGKQIQVSPELSRSLEAMALSTQNDGGETELSKDKSSSYTGLVSSAAIKVYDKIADAGSAAISKVKLDARNEEGDDKTVEKQSGEKVNVSSELSRPQEAMTVSSPKDGGETGLPKDQNSSYTGMVTSAASKVYEKVADAGNAVISKVKPDARNEEGDDKAAEKLGGTEIDESLELRRSLEGLTISEPPKDQNSSYTGMVSSAASKVYGMVADAGTAVISKVKPDAKKEGEDVAVDKQSKGISIKDYIAEKLTPGEDEKALSELITEAGHKRKNDAVELPPPEKTGSNEAGSGVGVVGRLKETVTSFLGGSGGSPKSPATQAQSKVIEEDKDFHDRTAEAISKEKRSSEELPTSYH